MAKKGRKAAISRLDLRKPGTEKALVEAVEREFGRLDILVNNAGATKRGSFFELTDADWQDGYALKFFAPCRLVRDAWPLLKAQQRLVRLHRRHQRQGARGRVHHRQLGQRRVAAFTKCLADIGKADGVQVNCEQSEPRRDRTAVAKRFRETMQATGSDEPAVRDELSARVRLHPLRHRGGSRDRSSRSWCRRTAAGCTAAAIDIDGGEVRSV